NPLKTENNIIFADNIDPHSFSQMLSSLKMEESFFITISKSGDTLETISQLLISLDYAAKTLGRSPAKNFLVITMQQESSLAKLAKRQGIETLEHSAKIGGRFSSFTNVGMLPSAIMGLDIKLIRKGAEGVIDSLTNPESEVAKGIA